MPTYSYKCPECSKVFDAFHSMSCTDPQYCPDCEIPATKLMSAGSVIFKGSGFYSTDYRDSGYLEAKNRDNSPSTPPDKPSGTKTQATKESSKSSTPASTATESPTSSTTPSNTSSNTSSAKAA